MARYIGNISGTIPHTHKSVNIPLEGRNLIITGGNGSGKTSFLRNAYEKAYWLAVLKELPSQQQINDLFEQQKEYQKFTKITGTPDNFNENIKTTNEWLKIFAGGIKIEIQDNIQFSLKHSDRKAVVLYFEDKRLSDIAEAKTGQSLQDEVNEINKLTYDQKLGNNLEQHLLNLKIRRSLAITEDKNKEFASKIDIWFDEFEKNLKHLFEDTSTKLLFNSDLRKFSIQQDDKPPYTFQTLSAGYRAIFDIYAGLLMHTEYFSISPAELEGVVFIDEIDSHLHVSLQRLILPFFTESFPEVQFIVTTHSPFVLMSQRGILVYDLGKEELYSVSQVKSQNEIMKEYLGVPVLMPVWAQESLEAIIAKYSSCEPDEISIAALKEELAKAGLETYFPESVVRVLESKQ